MAKFDINKFHKTVCVFAHPDDESFGPAGTIAKLATTGEVYVICVTDGGSKGGPKELSKVRKKELLHASKVLGVKKVFFLKYKDGELRNNIYHKVAKDIQEIVSSIKPDTLLTFELRGCSGHIDHVFTSMVTSYVFRESRFIKNILYFCDPDRVNKFVRKYFIYHPLGFPRSSVDLIFDVSEVQKLKEEAIMSHKSQRKDGIWILAFLKTMPKEEYFLITSK